MRYYVDGFRGGNPDTKNAAPNRRDRSPHAPLPEKVDVLIVGTGPAGLCLAAQLAQFPEIDTMIVESSPCNIEKGKADGINTRTMEMFQAFGFADKVKRESYWVNQTSFWMPDPENPAHIKRISRVQDVADDSSEMPHILINQARMHQLFLEVMRDSPSRLEPDYNLALLDLEIDSSIPDFISIAIDQGFAVPMMFEIEIRSEKPYWLDDKVVSLKQQYRLHYQPMLDSFVVLDVNTAERHYFDERKAAVQFIELVYNYPMLDINNLAADKNYYARVRFGIDSDELPLPLQSSWFWDSDWDLQSEWFEWEVRRPAS